MEFPDSVLEALLKRLRLPDSLSTLIFYLLVHEEENGFPAFYKIGDEHQNPPMEEICIAYATAFHYLLRKLPRVRDLDDSALHAPLADLAGVTHADLSLLAGPIRGPFGRPNKQASKLYEDYTRDELVDRLALSIWGRLLTFNLSFDIPEELRFEHTHVVGGTGHGKTQLLQLLIHQDLVRAPSDGRSIVVLDSQGDLIRAISHLRHFSREEFPEFADQFVLVDPTDVEYPVCLNMFDFNRDRLSGYGPVDREKILNATIEVYEYFFGALLGADLTQRQGLIFRYLARLLLEIPDATIHTLRELMEDGQQFRPYMEKLPGSARSFFATQFFDKKFGETKKQILTRLWGVLSNSSLERMFSHTRNRIDIFELLNSGKIVLINAAKDLLGQEGAAIFGRFFITLIAQAAVQRAAIPAEKRRAAFVYIDEAQDYFDDNIGHLLNQARKYRVGLTFAHQNLDQLSPGLRSTVLASTSIKFAGGVSARDAAVLDAEFRTDAQFLLDQRKERAHTRFACFIKNYTGSALSLKVPLGFLESEPQLSEKEYRDLIERNRSLYSEPPFVPPDVPFTEVRPRNTDRPTEVASKRARESIRARDAPEPTVLPAKAAPATQPLGTEAPIVPKLARRDSRELKPPADLGKGGQEHKYLQHLVKRLAEERGFRAVIEEDIGEGRNVDVLLRREGFTVACEISVTTEVDHELANIVKCAASGYSRILFIAASKRKRDQMVRRTSEAIPGAPLVAVGPEEIVAALESFEAPEATTESTVRGYKVKVKRQSVSPQDVASRRSAIAEVIARSLSKGAKT